MYAKLGVTVTALAAAVSAAPSTLVARYGDSYTFYQGDGSTARGWPAQSAWGSFDQLWSSNVPLMQKSCGWNGWGADNSAAEISNIKNAISQVSGESGVDKRFILAVMMQESKGCVRVPTTDNGVRNPGLMQSHNGSGSCAGQNPCPASQITQMIRDGASGTSSGDGLKQTLAKAQRDTGDNGSRKFYAGARIYNSGSADYSNLNNGLGSTPCYATDVANRLTGWTLAVSQCRA
ncbi:muramidase [Cordyceps javanica]|uniref:Muramidase n=1 Tax=Cordyceps javanica TaxID=43265 RepID=A0A545UQ30_9HYPO|nr:muramidase [Cordyceps javanica]TQW03645.1 muramidase [Cordyceps javanica]